MREPERTVPCVAGFGCILVLSSLTMFVDRFAGGLWLDIKRKIPWYCSDIYDGFHIQSISAVLFIYLGCITNAITFGGLLGDATDNYQVLMKLQHHEPIQKPIQKLSDYISLFPEGGDGEFPRHCFSRDGLLLVRWATSHHPQLNWTHPHL